MPGPRNGPAGSGISPLSRRSSSPPGGAGLNPRWPFWPQPLQVSGVQSFAATAADSITMGGSAFDPSSIAGMQLRLESDGITGLNNSDPVATWPDASGTGHNATQATGGIQPLYKTNQINGLPAVQFDGVDDFLGLSLTGGPKPFTLLAVVQPTYIAGHQHAILGSTPSSTGIEWRLSATSTKLDLLKQEVALIGTSTSAYTTGVAALAEVTYDGSGNYAFYKNTSADGTGTNNQTFGACTMRVGLGAAGEYYQGFIGAIFVYDSVLSTTDRQNVENYLGGKFGLGFGSVGGGGEAVTRTVSLPRPQADSATFAESPTRAVAFPRAIADSITFAESLAYSRGSTRPVTDSITFAETLTARIALVRAIADSVTFAEAPTARITLLKAISDSITFAESTTRAVGHPRSVSDSITFAETLVRTLALRKAISDSITFAESLVRVDAYARTLADSVTFAEAVTFQKGFTRTGTDSLTFADSVARTLGLVRPITGSVTLAESMTRAVTLARALADAITFAESVARVASHPRTVTDSIAFAESLVRIEGLARALTATITFSESLTGTIGGTTRTAADSITFSEALAARIALRKALADSVTLSDSAAAAIALRKAIVGTITFAEALSFQKGFTRSAADTVTFSEALTRGQLALLRALVGSITLTDSAARAASLRKAVTDAVSVADAVAFRRGFARTPSDHIAFAESLTHLVINIIHFFPPGETGVSDPGYASALEGPETGVGSATMTATRSTDTKVRE